MKRILLFFLLVIITGKLFAQEAAPVKYIVKYAADVSAYGNNPNIYGVSNSYTLNVNTTAGGWPTSLINWYVGSLNDPKSASGQVNFEREITSIEAYADYSLRYNDPLNSGECSGVYSGTLAVNSGYNMSGIALREVSINCSSSYFTPFYVDVKVMPSILIQNAVTADPAQTVFCDNGVVKLKMTYHGGGGSAVAWQYRVGNSGNFLPIRANYTGSEISFTLQDIFGAGSINYLSTPIQFRAAGAYAFQDGTPMNKAGEGSNVLTYSFSPSTILPSDIKVVDPPCGKGLSTALNIKFNRNLFSGERLTAITIYKVEDGADILFDQYQEPVTSLQPGNMLPLTGLAGMPPGNYYAYFEGEYNNVLQCNQTKYFFTVVEPLQVGFTVTGKQDVKCYGNNGGSIIVNATGGAGGYAYSKDDGVNWQSSNIFIGLAKGNYTIRVKDVNNCISDLSQVVTINEPAAPLAVSVTGYADPLGAVTNDGSVSIAVSGGTIPYTYKWSNGAVTQQLSGVGGGNHTVIVTDANNCTSTVGQQLIAPDPIVINFTETAISCNGVNDGSLQALVSGGVKPYTYNWPSTKRDNLGAGIYTLTVTDANGITFSNTYDLKQPALLKVTGTPLPTSCSGGTNGSISTAVTGGTTPYMYLWESGETTTSLNNLTAGIYTVAVTDGHGCKATSNIDVTSPDAIDIAGTVTTPTRYGSTDGSIAAVITGGTAPYNYLWYNGNTTNTITDLGDGSYLLSITDNHGCTASRTYNVAQPDPLTMNMVTTDVLCHGLSTGAIYADVKGGVLPYTYEWSNGASAATITGLPIGSYSVKITDKSGVITNGSYTVKEPSLLELSLTASEVSCGGVLDGAVRSTTNGGVTPYSYSWNTGASTPDLNGLNGGLYTLHITDAHGCILSKSASVTAPGALSVSAVVKDPVCYGYSNGAITLDVTGGRLPYSYEWSNGADSKDLRAVPAGNYNLSLRDRTGCLITYQYTLTDPQELHVDLGRDRTLCVGQSLALNASIPDGVSYSWNSSNGFMAATAAVTLSDAGSYGVLSTDSKGCIAKDEIIIKKDEREISAQFLVSSAAYTGENVVAVNVSQPVADRVNWLLPEGATVVSKSDLMVELNFKQQGHYKVFLTTFRGECESTSENDIMVLEGLNLPDITTVHSSVFKKVLLYPNPTNGAFKVEVETAEDVVVNYRFLDIQRNLVLFEQKGQLNKDVAQQIPFNIPGVSAGVYVLLIESPKEKKTLKVIVL